ncbi:MAG: hypothetical protein F6K28_23395 [Microcoleus sp. SIO2G3]|nr:hypothetical protein [Microcoleus sp. SIO2G3]
MPIYDSIGQSYSKFRLPDSRIVNSDAFCIFPPLKDVVRLIETNTQRTVEILPLMLPHDLTDMFFAAGWRRPEIYLNPKVRAGISALALADASVVEMGVNLLKEDLDGGQWDAKYGEIRKLEKIDAGYRFLYARIA